MNKHNATVLVVRNERANDDALHYPSRLFGVWYDTSEGPLPYLLDRHTHVRCTEALHAALTWVLVEQTGNRAVVYNRASGPVIARYCQATSVGLGYVPLTPRQTDVCSE
jgi:hypothetical protein